MLNIKGFFIAAAMLLLFSCEASKPAVEYFKLDNGLRVILMEDRSADTAAVHVFMPGSRLLEAEHNAGITELTASAWTRGGHGMTAKEISEAFGSLGARFGISAQQDFTAASLRTVPDVFEESFELLAGVLARPDFPEKEIEREKSQQKNAVRRMRDSLFEYGYEEFRSLFYPGHPYGLPRLGTVESVGRIEREDVLVHSRKLLSPGGMVIAAAGNFDSGSLKARIEDAFSTLKNFPAEPACSPPSAAGPRERSVGIDSFSCWLFIGFPGPEVRAEDYPAVKVLNAALGEGMSSRLLMKLREELALAYSAGSFFPARKHPSHVVVFAAVEASGAKQAKDAILDEIENLKNEGVSGEELKRARNFIRGRHLSGKETFYGRARNLARFEFLGMGYEYALGYDRNIEAVTAADVRTAAKKYLQAPVIATLGPENAPPPPDCAR